MIKTLTYNLHDITPYINWVYFFHAWGFPPKYSGISEIHACMACRTEWVNGFKEEDQARAKVAIQLYDDALKMLNGLDSTYHTYARFGLLTAASVGDDIIIQNENKNQELLVFPFLRQQHTTNENQPNLCLSDFIRPQELGGNDTLGAFATTVDPQMEHLFDDDDYDRMLVQTLCDRLAEGTAEKMHEDVRRTYWGYAPNEHLTIKELLIENYQGIRPAVGYPSMPDQSVNFLIEELIKISDIGILLTENGAMKPHASVCGLMFSHPQSYYFSIGKIEEDQLKDYAERRGIDLKTARKFLAANLN